MNNCYECIYNNDGICQNDKNSLDIEGNCWDFESRDTYDKGYQQGRADGRADAIQDIRVEIANRVPSRPITKRAIEVWEDKYWLLINLDKKLEQMQKGTE